MVQRFETHLALSSESNAHKIVDAIGNVVKNRLPPEMDQIIRAVDDPDQQLVIPRLEIDMGQIDLVQYEQRFLLAFKRHFEEKLRSLTKGAGRVPAKSMERQTVGQSEIDALKYFLQRGYLPWWFPEEKTLADLLDHLREKHPHELDQVLFHPDIKRAELHRILHQLGIAVTEETLETLDMDLLDDASVMLDDQAGRDYVDLVLLKLTTTYSAEEVDRALQNMPLTLLATILRRLLDTEYTAFLSFWKEFAQVVAKTLPEMPRAQQDSTKAVLLIDLIKIVLRDESFRANRRRWTLEAFSGLQEKVKSSLSAEQFQSQFVRALLDEHRTAVPTLMEAFEGTTQLRDTLKKFRPKLSKRWTQFLEKTGRKTIEQIGIWLQKLGITPGKWQEVGSPAELDTERSFWSRVRRYWAYLTRADLERPTLGQDEAERADSDLLGSEDEISRETMDQQKEESISDLRQSVPPGQDLEDFLLKEQQEDWARETPDPDQKIYVYNAGLVLLWIFFARFFEDLSLIRKEGKKNVFINIAAQQRAVLLTQYLVTGKTAFEERDLVLNKILCGYNVTSPIPLKLDLTEEERRACDIVLNSAIQHWEVLKNTSREGLRENFLQREGVIRYKQGNVYMKVAQKSIDILVERIPWTFRTIKLSWNDYIIFVEWVF